MERNASEESCSNCGYNGDTSFSGTGSSCDSGQLPDVEEEEEPGLQQLPIVQHLSKRLEDRRRQFRDSRGSSTVSTEYSDSAVDVSSTNQQQQQQHHSSSSSSHLRVLHESLAGLASRLGQSQQQQQPQSQVEGQTRTLQRFKPKCDSRQGLQYQMAAVGVPGVRMAINYRDDRLRGRDRRTEKRLSAGDNREKLADYLRQCELSMPKPENRQLDAIGADLQVTWNQLESNTPPLTGKVIKQQAAIWELCQTELNILRHLKTIIEVYVNVIHHLQSSASLLTDVATQRLFPSLSGVFQAHYTLWSEHLKPALLAARQRGHPVRPRDFRQGFESFQGIFQPSMEFCMNISDCKEYLRLLEKNEAFNDFVKWAQKFSARNYTSEDGSVDLQLKSLLTTPFQRITKYGLLLQEILKHTEEPEDREALDAMIPQVSDFCSHLNSCYQRKTDEDEVRGVAEKLEDAKMQETIDSFGDDCASFLDQFKLSLLRPMPHNGQQRRKIFEGDLKLKDERGKWSEAKCLLFTDLLLLVRGSKRQSLRPLRPPIRLDKLMAHRLGDGSCSFVMAALTDFNSIEGLICLAAPDQRQCDDWLERIRQARTILMRQLQLPTGGATSAKMPASPCPRCGHASSQAASSVSLDSAVPLQQHHQQQPPPPPNRWLSEPAPRPRPTLHCAHSTGELDGMLSSSRDTPTPPQQQQPPPPSAVITATGETAGEGGTAGAAASFSFRLETELAGSFSTDDGSGDSGDNGRPSRGAAASTGGGSAGWPDGTIPVKELTPERRRLLISLTRAEEGRESSQV